MSDRELTSFNLSQKGYKSKAHNIVVEWGLF